MNQAISMELRFFLVSILWGAIVLFIYDGFRILRRLIRHNNFFLILEDLIFWVSASVFIFAMIYTLNNGTIRGFSVMGMSIGMLLYHYIFSDVIVHLVTKLFRILLKPIKMVIARTKKLLRSVFLAVKKVLSRLFDRLKKIAKSRIMKLKEKKAKKQEKKKEKLAQKRMLKEKQKNEKKDKKNKKDSKGRVSDHRKTSANKVEDKSKEHKRQHKKTNKKEPIKKTS